VDESRLSKHKASSHRFQKTKKCFQIFKGTFLISQLKTISVAYIASQVPEKQIHDLGLLFKQIDTNCDGFITIE
jgi:hypothetical protein